MAASASVGPIPHSEIPDSTGNSAECRDSEGILQPADDIDSALKAALREPRERLALLKVETAMMDFCNNPQDGWLEVGGPYNSISIGSSASGQGKIPPALAASSSSSGGIRPATSFQRCVLHRLADRFGIVRANGVVIEGSIRLIKVPETKIPSVLLQDLDPSEYMLPEQQQQSNATTASEGAAGLATALSQTSLDGGAATTNGTPQQPPRKMKIMKRSDSNKGRSLGGRDGGTNSKQLVRKSSSVSDKEKAYAEARARIFSEESGGADGDSSSATNQAPAAAAGSADSAFPSAAPASGGGGTPSRPAAAAQSPLRSLPSNESSSTSSLNKAEELSSTPSSENKAVYRNRVEEAADPDFRRGVVVYPPYYPAGPPVGVVPAGTGGGVAYPHSQHMGGAQHQQMLMHQQQHQQMGAAAYYSPHRPTHPPPPPPPPPPPTPPAAPSSKAETTPSLTADAPAFYPSSMTTKRQQQEQQPQGNDPVASPPGPSGTYAAAAAAATSWAAAAATSSQLRR